MKKLLLLVCCLLSFNLFAASFEDTLALANQGVAKAQYELGAKYHLGNGVKQNSKKAVEWYQKAAQQGLAVAQFNLANMYDKGVGVRKNSKAAFEWYQKAANQGLPIAQYYVGMLYHGGWG